MNIWHCKRYSSLFTISASLHILLHKHIDPESILLGYIDPWHARAHQLLLQHGTLTQSAINGVVKKVES